MSRVKTDWSRVDEDDKAFAHVTIVGSGRMVHKLCMLILLWAKSKDVMITISK